MQIAVLALLVIVGILAATFYYQSQRRNVPTADNSATQPASGPAATAPTTQKREPRLPPDPAIWVGLDLGDSLLLGNPSKATPDPSNKDNYLLSRPTYALSWNDSRGTPNWVSWRTVRSNFGDGKRPQVDFMADPLLPAGFKQIDHADYTRSGFDRGHMCPNADRDATTALAEFTFFTSNVVPQSPRCNQKAWNQLEAYARDLVTRRNMRLYTVAGALGKGGEGVFGPRQTLGEHDRITVPAECWKIIVAIPDTGGPDDPAAVTADARVIAVLMPNDQSVGEEWAGYRVTPEELERRSGYTFFDRLAPTVAQKLRQKLDTEFIPPVKPFRPGKPRSDATPFHWPTCLEPVGAISAAA